MIWRSRPGPAGPSLCREFGHLPRRSPETDWPVHTPPQQAGPEMPTPHAEGVLSRNGSSTRRAHRTRSSVCPQSRQAERPLRAFAQQDGEARSIAPRAPPSLCPHRLQIRVGGPANKCSTRNGAGNPDRPGSSSGPNPPEAWSTRSKRWAAKSGQERRPGESLSSSPRSLVNADGREAIQRSVLSNAKEPSFGQGGARSAGKMAEQKEKRSGAEHLVPAGRASICSEIPRSARPKPKPRQAPTRPPIVPGRRGDGRGKSPCGQPPHLEKAVSTSQLYSPRRKDWQRCWQAGHVQEQAVKGPGAHRPKEPVEIAGGWGGGGIGREAQEPVLQRARASSATPHRAGGIWSSSPHPRKPPAEEAWHGAARSMARRGRPSACLGGKFAAVGMSRRCATVAVRGGLEATQPNLANSSLARFALLLYPLRPKRRNGIAQAKASPAQIGRPAVGPQRHQNVSWFHSRGSKGSGLGRSRGAPGPLGRDPPAGGPGAWALRNSATGRKTCQRVIAGRELLEVHAAGRKRQARSPWSAAPPVADGSEGGQSRPPPPSAMNRWLPPRGCAGQGQVNRPSSPRCGRVRLVYVGELCFGCSGGSTREAWFIEQAGLRSAKPLGPAARARPMAEA